MHLPTPLAAIYVVQPAFLSDLCNELGTDELLIVDDLVFSSQNKANVCFAQDVWLEPQVATFQSISEAVQILKQAGKFWYLHPLSHVRRSRLIEAQLRQCKTLTQSFPLTTPIPDIGSFCLLDNHTLVYSTTRWKKWPDGACFFIEDKVNPPNRAYLKLWEALTLLDAYPQPGDVALDLGASPGGWTYVMQSLGCLVTAVDKAALDPNISALPGVDFLQQSAFALDPNACDKTYDWVLSDIACYPERAYALIMKWIASGKAKRLIVTIKLQGTIELSALAPFQAIPNSRTLHLSYNKHEVTFFYPAYV